MEQLITMKTKFYILTILIFYVCFKSSAQSKTNFESYGELFDSSQLTNYVDNKEIILNNPQDKVKLKGKILSTCPMKGCWDENIRSSRYNSCKI